MIAAYFLLETTYVEDRPILTDKLPLKTDIIDQSRVSDDAGCQ